MIVSFTDAICSATEEILSANPLAYVMGLGASYPNGADGTLKGLAAKFPGRIYDTPCSEAAITGMAVGAATTGMYPIIHHGRVEFALYAMDAILTQSANWHSMFGGGYQCPLLIRIAVGRAWSNGAQHTRCNKSMFAVPGLKVVAPSSPHMAKQLLLAAAKDLNPVIYLESRWLYKIRGAVKNTPCDIGQAQVLRTGTDVTIVAVADMVIEALKAAQWLSTMDINAEVIDLVSVYPLDIATVQESVNKTGRLVAVDAANPAYSTAHEIISNIKAVTATSITCPDMPCPTAPALACNYYPTDQSIIDAVCKALRIPVPEFKPKTFDQLNLPPKDNFDDLR